jgi:prepilin-type N-terminal cleavage/methylation domain-containing protein
MTRFTRPKQCHARPRAGVSLTELLCVMGILCVLSVFYLGAILRAYQKIMAFIKTLQ